MPNTLSMHPAALDEPVYTLTRDTERFGCLGDCEHVHMIAQSVDGLQLLHFVTIGLIKINGLYL